MRSSTLLTTTLACSLALAQNNTTICINQDDIDDVANGHINSTGTSPITWNSTGSDTPKPWYMSILVNNTGRDSDNGGTISWPYLSVPVDDDANACVYSFGSQNKTATDSSCGGVLSGTCSAYMREAVQNGSRGLGGPQGRCQVLPTTEADRARRDEACGSIKNIGFVSWENVGNDTCTYNSLAGVQLPDNYTSRLMGISLMPFNNTPAPRWDGSDQAAYDLTVVQSMPFAVVALRNMDNGASRTEVQFVCVTPNNTQPGSRVVENKTPWPTSGAVVGWGAGPGLSVVVVGVAALLFTL